MKIINAGTTPTKESQRHPRTRRKKGRLPGAIAVQGNDQTLRRMLDCIDDYRASKLQLPALVNELEFHLQSLIQAEHGWQQAFFRRWRDLDREHAQQVSRGDLEISTDSLLRIEAALTDLGQLVEDTLANCKGLSGK